MRREKTPPINAGSVADVAFLLLIFFLVTTTIQTEAGLPTTLPPWSEENVLTPSGKVLSLQLNAQGALLIEGNSATLEEVPRYLDLLLEKISAKKAIVHLKHDQQVDYAHYLAVHNAVKAAYQRRWNAQALDQYGRAYSDLSPKIQQEIRRSLPLVFAETQWIAAQ